MKREDVCENLLGVLPLIRDHFAGVAPDFYQGIDRRYYPVARGLMVPFEPPMIYGIGGQLYFPWFSFWRQNPLAKERLSLFVTLVDEVMLQDPDLETARFEVLDFRVAMTINSRFPLFAYCARLVRTRFVFPRPLAASPPSPSYLRAQLVQGSF